MNKTSASRAGAHTIEALVGAVLGSGAGAGAGFAGYSPKEPVEWTDETGAVYSRPLSEAEKKQRRQLMARAALIGALGGGAVSVGAGGIHRGGVTKVEKATFEKVTDPYLNPFRKVVAEKAERVEDLKGATFYRTSHAKRVKEEAALSSKLLKEQEDKVRALLEAARQSRLTAPWGGMRTGKARTTAAPTGADQRNMWGAHEAHALEGRVGRHFLNLQKEHNLPPLRSKQDTSGKDFFRAYVDRMMTKKSSVFEEAFQREVLAISRTV